MSQVVRLVDHAPVPVDGHAGLIDWLRSWVDGLEAGDYGQLRTVVLVVENKEGQVATVSQSEVPMDKARRLGLLYAVLHRDADGVNIGELER